MTQPPPDEWDDEPVKPGPPLVYATVDDWVEEFLAPVYRRALGTQRTWCPEWWRHPEAIGRLEALWRAWEHLHHQPALGVSVWYRDHADPHMAVLLDEEGPFKYCHPTEGHKPRLEPLPCTPRPADLR